MQIIFDITENQKQRVIDAVKGLFPVPLNPAGEPLFSDGAWAKERFRRMIIQTVYAYETKVATEQITRDDDLVT